MSSFVISINGCYVVCKFIFQLIQGDDFFSKRERMINDYVNQPLNAHIYLYYLYNYEKNLKPYLVFVTCSLLFILVSLCVNNFYLFNMIQNLLINNFIY